MERKKIWMGEHTCNLCGKECKDVLYDGATKMGPWAVMCRECMANFGVGVGAGKGQEYWKNSETGEFEKTRG